MKFVTHQTTLHLSFKIKCCVDRLRPPGLNGLQAEVIHGRLTHRLVPLGRAQLEQNHSAAAYWPSSALFSARSYFGELLERRHSFEPPPTASLSPEVRSRQDKLHGCVP